MAILFTVLVGVFTGFSAGMFGIGGALISTPLLRELVDLPAHLAVATPLPATLPAAISGSIIYARERLLRLDVAGWVLVTGVPFNLLGVELVPMVSGPLLMVLTGVMLLYSALIFLQRSMKRRQAINQGKDGEDVEKEKIQRSVLLLTGAVAGMLSGFLAIGGGVVLVPAFVQILRLPTRQALATSLFCVAVFALPGIIGHSRNGIIDWGVAGILCLTVFPFSALGAKAATRIRSHKLELVYGIAMLMFAIFFILRNL